jgi:hypothetical protein
MQPIKFLSYLQSYFYLLCGIWPLVHIHSFMYISGPKVDIWLVKTVGVLISIIGLTILSAAQNKRLDSEIFILAFFTAASLAVIDVVYVFKGVISSVYLIDAAIEIILAGAWLFLKKDCYNV